MQAASRTGASMHTEDNVAAALAKAHELTKPDGVVVVTGSIFLVGEAMSGDGDSMREDELTHRDSGSSTQQTVERTLSC